MSDLFSEPHGIPEFSKAFSQAWDAANAARIYAVAMTEQEVWRFAPGQVDQVEFAWVDDPDASYLSLRRMSGTDFIIEDGAELDGLFARQWDAVESLVYRLAESWEDARSTFMSTDIGWFYINRPKEF